MYTELLPVSLIFDLDAMEKKCLEEGFDPLRVQAILEYLATNHQTLLMHTFKDETETSCLPVMYNDYTLVLNRDVIVKNQIIKNE